MISISVNKEMWQHSHLYCPVKEKLSERSRALPLKFSFSKKTPTYVRIKQWWMVGRVAAVAQ